VDQGRAHDEPLLHAVGITLDQFILPLLQLKNRQKILHPRFQLRRVVETVKARNKMEELQACQLLIHERPVRDEPGALLDDRGRCSQVVPVDDDPPACR